MRCSHFLPELWSHAWICVCSDAWVLWPCRWTHQTRHRVAGTFPSTALTDPHTVTLKSNSEKRELSCTPAHIYLPGCAIAFLEPDKCRKVRHSCRSGHPKRNENVWKETRKGTDLGEVQCHVICSLMDTAQLRDSTAVVAAQGKRLTKPTPIARAAALPGAQRVSSTSEHPLNKQ